MTKKEEKRTILLDFMRYKSEIANSSITMEEWNLEKAKRFNSLKNEKQAQEYKKELKEIKARMEYLEKWLIENNF